MKEELIDPKTINYPANAAQWETYMRLKLARGQSKLTFSDVQRIEAARARRAHRDPKRYAV